MNNFFVARQLRRGYYQRENREHGFFHYVFWILFWLFMIFALPPGCMLFFGMPLIGARYEAAKQASITDCEAKGLLSYGDGNGGFICRPKGWHDMRW